MTTHSQTQPPNVFVEYCRSCDTHSWCTHHDQAKYHQTFLKITELIAQRHPHLEVIGNMVPSHLIPFKIAQNKYIDSETNKYVIYPQIGSFQISFNDQIIFSKKQTNGWPHLPSILDRISTILDPNFQSPRKEKKSKSKSPKKIESPTKFKSNDFLKSTDEKRTRYKDQSKGFTLTDHFKLYRSKNKQQEQDWLTQKPQSAGSSKQMSDIARTDSRQKSDYSDSKVTLKDLAGESKLKEMLKNKTLLVKDHGKKEMIIKLHSIEEENVCYDQNGGTQRTQKNNKNKKIKELEDAFSSLENKFINFQTKVKNIQTKNSQFQFKGQTYHEQTNKSRNKDFKKESHAKHNENRLPPFQHFIERESRLEQYISATEEEKNEKLHRIYGEWKLLRQTAKKNNKILKKRQRKSPQNQPLDDQQYSQTNSHSQSQSSMGNVLTFKPKAQNNLQRHISSIINSKAHKLSTAQLYPDTHNDLSNEPKFRTQDNFYQGRLKRQNIVAGEQPNRQTSRNVGRVVKNNGNSMSVQAQKGFSKQSQHRFSNTGQREVGKINHRQLGQGQANSEVSHFSSNARQNINKIHARMHKLTQKMNDKRQNENVSQIQHSRSQSRTNKGVPNKNNKNISHKVNNNGVPHKNYKNVANKDNNNVPHQDSYQIPHKNHHNGSHYNNSNTPHKNNSKTPYKNNSNVSNCSTSRVKSLNKDFESIQKTDRVPIREGASLRQKSSRLVVKEPKQGRQTIKESSINKKVVKQPRINKQQVNESIINKQVANEPSFNRRVVKGNKNSKHISQKSRSKQKKGQNTAKSPLKSTEKMISQHQSGRMDHKKSKNIRKLFKPDNQIRYNEKGQALGKVKRHGDISNIQEEQTVLNSYMEYPAEDSSNQGEGESQYSETSQKQSQQSGQQEVDSTGTAIVKGSKSASLSKQNTAVVAVSKAPSLQQENTSGVVVADSKTPSLTQQNAVVVAESKGSSLLEQNIRRSASQKQLAAVAEQKTFQQDNVYSESKEPSEQKKPISNEESNQVYVQTQQFEKHSAVFLAKSNSFHTPRSNRSKFQDKQQVSQQEEQAQKAEINQVGDAVGVVVPVDGSLSLEEKSVEGPSRGQQLEDGSQVQQQDNVYTQPRQPSKYRQIGIQKQLTNEVSVQTQQPQQIYPVLMARTNTLHSHRSKALSKESARQMEDKSQKSQFNQTGNKFYQSNRGDFRKKSDKQVERAHIIGKIFSTSVQGEIDKFSSVIGGSEEVVVREEGSVVRLAEVYPAGCLLNDKNLQIDLIETKFPQLLKTIQILCEKSEWLISRLFEDRCGKLKDKAFGVWLCRQYEWQCYVVNDTIKVNQQSQPLYSKHHGNQMWYNVLQKTLALALNGYQQLQKADSSLLFTMLTGCNAITSRVKEDPTKNNKLLHLISDCLKKNYVIHATKNWDNHKPEGRQSVYYIHSVRKSGENQTLIEMSQDNRQSFWLKLTKFSMEFNIIHILQLRISHNFTHLDLGVARPGQLTVIQLDFQDEGQGCVTLAYLGEKGSLQAFLYREEKNKVLKLVGQAKEKNKNNLFFQCNFIEGKYYLFSQAEERAVRLAFLGQSQPQLQITEEIHSQGLKNDMAEYLPVNNQNKSRRTDQQFNIRESKSHLRDKFLDSRLRDNFVDYVMGRSRRN